MFLGAAVYSIRLRLGLKQVDLAREICVSQSNVSDLEMGRLAPSTRVAILLLAMACGPERPPIEEFLLNKDQISVVTLLAAAGMGKERGHGKT